MAPKHKQLNLAFFTKKEL
jgi:hypothetical protein